MMRITVGFICSLALFAGVAQAQSNIGIGTESPHPSAELDVNSSTRGFLPPRMTFAQINAIANPAPGLIIYCTDCGPNGQLQFFQGNSWQGVSAVPLTVPGLIQSLSCTTSSHNGALTQGVSASGVSSLIAYTGGNGAYYPAQQIPSTGVSGLTANLAAGNFANGAGSITFTITGVPASSGTANFALNLGGQSCTLSRNVNVNTVSSATAHNCGVEGIHNPNLSYGNMTDQDGNNYKTIQIGSQTWMAENLRTSRYRNGDVIPIVTDNSAWKNLNTGASCWYNNDSSSYDCPYGRLYNWYAVVDSRNLCPTGWHAPSEDELYKLNVQLGWIGYSGIKVKSTSTLWSSPRSWADNRAGFSGLPGGLRSDSGSYNNIGTSGSWWGTTRNSQFTGNPAVWRYLASSQIFFLMGTYQNIIHGMSVRCVRDSSNPIQGTVSTLSCSGANNEGGLSIATTANEVRSSIPYSGGNGGTYPAQSIISSGVLGLTASLVAGDFSYGAGELNYKITGIPASSGTAQFSINIGGQTCILSRVVTDLSGTVSTLNCSTASNLGTLTAGSAANNVSSSLTYSGGNGNSYPAQSVKSTGVLGLTASIGAGNLNNGNGSLTFNITGNPLSSGTASFALSIGGQNCILNRSVGGSASVIPSITIGNQVWSTRNLDVARYRNGDPIPQVTDANQWFNLTTGAWCWYNNDSSKYAATYGRLYNWYAVNDPRGLAPVGWHIPSDLEWTRLTQFLDAQADTSQCCSNSAGAALKNTIGWLSPNNGANNSSGFTGLPGGMRIWRGDFYALGVDGYWWSSTPQQPNGSLAYFRNLNTATRDLFRFYDFGSAGFSVRLVKD